MKKDIVTWLLWLSTFLDIVSVFQILWLMNEIPALFAWGLILISGTREYFLILMLKEEEGSNIRWYYSLKAWNLKRKYGKDFHEVINEYARSVVITEQER